MSKYTVDFQNTLVSLLSDGPLHYYQSSLCTYFFSREPKVEIQGMMDALQYLKTRYRNLEPYFVFN